jgi:methionine sulfoxide reductase heme-binding subunit
MSVGYQAVQWNPNKRRYDLVLAACVAGYLAAFVLLGKLVHRGDRAISDPILLMRAFGTCAVLLLHVVLCIGPLARLDQRFLPLLYNRRHLGVATFGVGAAHALLAFAFYNGFGDVPAPVALLSSNTQFRSVSAFPFELLGLAGLLVLFLMAATSHDFWLKNLSPSVWKALHMLVYPAWALLVLHVALGAMQSERSLVYPLLLGLGVIAVSSLHLIAGRREARKDVSARGNASGWLDVGPVERIPENRAKVVSPAAGERIAVFRYGGKISAVTNVCAHQGGPLGEGKVIDGCITCPWHGYQYRPGDGRAPAPFTERICTFRVRVSQGRVLLDPRPLPPGTPVAPAEISEAHHELDEVARHA